MSINHAPMYDAVFAFLDRFNVKHRPHQPDSIQSFFRFLSSFLVFLILFVFVAGYYVTSRSFPLTEGWHEALIYFEKNGRAIYDDFEFLLPPMTYWFTKFRYYMVGDSFLLNRVIGLILNLANCALIYFWIRSYFTRQAALAACLLYSIVTLSAPAFIPRDYHNLVDFFLFLIANVILRPNVLRAPSLFIDIVTFFFAGLLTGALFLTKQNTGFVVGFFLTSALIGLSIATRLFHRFSILKIVLVIHFFILGSAITLVVASKVLFDAFDPTDMLKRFMLVESKGGFLQIAFRFIHEPFNRKILLISMICGLALFLFSHTRVIHYVVKTPLQQFPLFRIFKQLIEIVRQHELIVITTVFVLYLKYVGFNSSSISLFAISFFFRDVLQFIYQFFRHRLPAPLDWLRIGMFGGLIYSNSLTAGFNDSGTIVLSTFYLAFVFSVFQRKSFLAPQNEAFASSVVVIALIGLVVFDRTSDKVRTPYSWWGLSEPSALAGKTQLAVPTLAGLKLPSSRANLINDVRAFVVENTMPTDPIFVYPHMPVIYQLTGRLPSGRTYVQWYDFVTNKSLAKDIEHYVLNPPKVIVFMSLPEFVKQGHLGLIGRPLMQEIYFDYLDCMVNFGGYEKVHEFIYNNDPTREIEREHQLFVSRTLSPSERALLTKKLRAFGIRLTASGILSEELQKAGMAEHGVRLTVIGSENDLVEFVRREGRNFDFEIEFFQEPYALKLLKRREIKSTDVQMCGATALTRVRNYQDNFQ